MKFMITFYKHISLDAQYVMWTALRLTMFSHWTSSLWWFLGLPSPFDAYALVSWLRVKDHFIAYMRGTFQNNYIMPEYYQKGFSPTMVKDSFLVICLKFYPQTFGIFHTKPIILISWYYLWVQISERAQLLSVFSKLQLPCLDHFFLHSRLKNCAKQL